MLDEAVARLQTEWDESPTTGRAWGNVKPAVAPVQAVAEELARYTGRPIDGCQRSIYRIRHRLDHYSGGGSKPVAHVTERLADEILCALGEQERWHTDPRLRIVREEDEMIPAGRTPKMRFAHVPKSLYALHALLGLEAPCEFRCYWIARFEPHEIERMAAEIA